MMDASGIRRCTDSLRSACDPASLRRRLVLHISHGARMTSTPQPPVTQERVQLTARMLDVTLEQ
jgi:hypothetical protein